MPKIERNGGSPSAVSSPKAQAVTRMATPTEVASPSKAPSTAYTGQAAPPKELVPKQQPVTRSADPSALWGEKPKTIELDPEAFSKLPPAEQRETLQSLRAERQQLRQEIEARLAQLDVKWQRSRLSTRTEALREYQEKTAHLEPAQKQELDALLDRAEGSQRKINALRARIDRLPKTAEEKASMRELRTELARELRRLRAEQSRVVKEATEVIDAEGLKTDRLAVTEQIIDPSAPPQGSGESLFDKVLRAFKLDGFFSALDQYTAAVQSFSREVQERGEQIEAEVREKRDRVVQKQRDDEQRREMSRLTSK